MEKKSEKPQAKKQKNRTEIEHYVDKALANVNINGKKHVYTGGRYDDRVTLDVDFADSPWTLADNGTDIDSVVNKISELSTYNAIKNNKRFKEAVDTIAKKLAANLIEETVDTQKQIEKDKIYQEKQRKQQEAFAKKQAVANAKIAEKAAIAKAKLDDKRAKAEAQKNIFKECLTASQKKAFKKFYGVDITK